MMGRYDLAQIERDLCDKLQVCRSHATERGLPFNEKAMLRKFANKASMSKDSTVLML